MVHVYNKSPVAPYVGAWIETCFKADEQQRNGVAPYVGAWIETIFLIRDGSRYKVAPYVGAWIETSIGRFATTLVA